MKTVKEGPKMLALENSEQDHKSRVARSVQKSLSVHTLSNSDSKNKRLPPMDRQQRRKNITSIQKHMTKVWCKLDTECNISQVISLENQLKLKRDQIETTEKKLYQLSKQAVKDEKEYIQRQESETNEELKVYRFNQNVKEKQASIKQLQEDVKNENKELQ